MADDDPFGLGDFAVFLGDDPLPTRPSVLKEKEELNEDFDYMTRIPGVSPTKETPAWRIGKPKYLSSPGSGWKVWRMSRASSCRAVIANARSVSSRIDPIGRRNRSVRS